MANINDYNVKLESGQLFPLKRVKITVGGKLNKSVYQMADGSILLFDSKGERSGLIRADNFPKEDEFWKHNKEEPDMMKYKRKLKQKLSNKMIEVMID